MHRSNNEKSKFIFMVLILLVLGIGIGYAVLSERLTVSNYVNYGSMKWDIGFTSVQDITEEIVFTETFTRYPEMVEYLVPVDVSPSNDKKSISINADFGMNTSYKMVYVLATVENNSTFDVVVTDFGLVENEESEGYLEYFTDENYFYWVDDETLEAIDVVSKGTILKAGESKTLLINYNFLEIEEYNLPTEGLKLDFTIFIDFEEFDKDLISFDVDYMGEVETYYAEPGMTFGEWVESEYSNGNYVISTSNTIKRNGTCSPIQDGDFRVNPDSVIKSDYHYYRHPC